MSSMFAMSPAANFSKRPDLRSTRRKTLSAPIMGTARSVLTATVVTFLLVCTDDAAQARDPLAGDVGRVKMIGFTVADLDRET